MKNLDDVMAEAEDELGVERGELEGLFPLLDFAERLRNVNAPRSDVLLASPPCINHSHAGRRTT